HEHWGSKRQSKEPRIDENEAEIQQFWALLDRIQAMNKYLKNICVNKCWAEERSTAQNSNEKIKSKWNPSFEWEDFREDYMNDSGRGERCSGTSLKKHKNQDIMLFSNKYNGLDLNVEATPENELPVVLPLFR
ncbi:hypothetical protein KI387_035677, partial [Taxus chinensis]